MRLGPAPLRRWLVSQAASIRRLCTSTPPPPGLISRPPPLHFDESTTPSPVDSTSGRSRCSIAKGWSQGRGVYGGVLLAQVARAAQQRLRDVSDAAEPPTRRLRSINMSFLAPVSPGEVLLTASILRSGSAVSHVRVELHQGGEAPLSRTGGADFRLAMRDSGAHFRLGPGRRGTARSATASDGAAARVRADEGLRRLHRSP